MASLFGWGGWVFFFFAFTEPDSTTCVCPDSVASWLDWEIACIEFQDLKFGIASTGTSFVLVGYTLVWVHTSYLFLHEPEYLN